jgi:hypothetical protein
MRPRKAFYRARAHSNPFNDTNTLEVPPHPDAYDWYGWQHIGVDGGSVHRHMCCFAAESHRQQLASAAAIVCDGGLAQHSTLGNCPLLVMPAGPPTSLSAAASQVKRPPLAGMSWCALQTLAAALGACWSSE